MNYQEARPQLPNVLLLMAGGVLGGLSGLLIMEVVIDRIIWGAREDETEEDGLVTMAVDSAEGIDIKMLDEYQKPPLSELVREYNPNPMDSEEPVIVLVSKAFVDEHADLNNLETIFYYQNDQVYAFEAGEMINEPNEFFIPNAHLHFGEESDCADIVYVWNGHTAMFYEVVSVKGSYAEEVLGEVPEPPKPPKPKRSRRAATPKKKKAAPSDVADEIHEDDGKA